MNDAKRLIAVKTVSGENNPAVNERPGILSVADMMSFESNRRGRWGDGSQSRLDLGRTATFR